MNQVFLIGRLTKDVEVKYSANQMAIAYLNIAIGRGKDKEGNDKGTDFINVKVFGKQGENCERFLKKGDQAAIQGRIQTGSYEKDDKRVFTTDVIGDRVEFLNSGNKKEDGVQKYVEDAIPQFEAVSEDIPF